MTALWIENAARYGNSVAIFIQKIQAENIKK